MAIGFEIRGVDGPTGTGRRAHRMETRFGWGSSPMQRQFVLTLTGPDRIGIVERVTRLLLDRGGNVETSRMARLGGEFAILSLVSMPAEQFAGLGADLESLAAEGYKVTT